MRSNKNHTIAKLHAEGLSRGGDPSWSTRNTRLKPLLTGTARTKSCLPGEIISEGI